MIWDCGTNGWHPRAVSFTKFCWVACELQLPSASTMQNQTSFNSYAPVNPFLIFQLLVWHKSRKATKFVAWFIGPGWNQRLKMQSFKTKVSRMVWVKMQITKCAMCEFVCWLLAYRWVSIVNNVISLLLFFSAVECTPSGVQMKLFFLYSLTIKYCKLWKSLLGRHGYF